MSQKFYIDEFPSWHKFELIVRDALRPHLPGGCYAGLLLNRWIGRTEADLLYAGTTEGRRIAVIVECKNRPIEVSGSTIYLPAGDSEAPIDLMVKLDLKAHYARTVLGYEDIRFVVVGRTEAPFRERVTSDIFAVGQPIVTRADSTTIQNFSPLTSTWLEAVNGIEPLRLDSVDYAKLRKLRRFTPWDTVEAQEVREDLDREREWQCFLRDRESGQYLGD